MSFSSLSFDFPSPLISLLSYDNTVKMINSPLLCVSILLIIFLLYRRTLRSPVRLIHASSTISISHCRPAINDIHQSAERKLIKTPLHVLLRMYCPSLTSGVFQPHSVRKKLGIIIYICTSEHPIYSL